MKKSKIKEALMRVLAQFNEISSDKGVLVWRSENELPEVGENIYILDEDGTEHTAEDGHYICDNGWELVIENGSLKEIIDIREQNLEEEETVAEEANDAAEEIAKEIIDVVEDDTKTEEEKAEEIKDLAEDLTDVMEGEKVEEEFEEDDVMSLEDRVAALEKQIAEIAKKLLEPAAESAEEEFKKLNRVSTDEKFGKLNKRLTAKW